MKNLLCASIWALCTYLILFAFSSPLFAQTHFQLVLDTPSIYQWDWPDCMRTSDNGFVVMHRPKDGEPGFQRYSDTGAPLWRRQLTGPGSPQYPMPQAEATDGGFFVPYYREGILFSDSADAFVSLSKLDAIGGLSWTRECAFKYYNNFNQWSYNEAGLYLTADSSLFTILSGDHGSHIVRWQTDGTVDWVREYAMNGFFDEGLGKVTSVLFDGVDGWYVVFVSDDFFPELVVLHLASDGSLDWCKQYDLSNAAWFIRGQKALVNSANELVIAGAMTTGSQSYDFLLNVDPMGQVNWWFGYDNYVDRVERLVQLSDGSYRMVGGAAYWHSVLWSISPIGQLVDYRQSTFNPFTMGDYTYYHMHRVFDSPLDDLFFVGSVMGEEPLFGQHVTYNTIWSLPIDLSGTCWIQSSNPVNNTVPIPSAIQVITDLGVDASVTYSVQDTSILTEITLATLSVASECAWNSVEDGMRLNNSLVLLPTLCYRGEPISVQTGREAGIEVFDSFGRLVLPAEKIAQNEQHVIVTRDLSSGVFIARATFEDGSTTTQRFVLE